MKGWHRLLRNSGEEFFKLLKDIIKLIIKILATTIVIFPIGGILTILSIIFWDAKYIDVANHILTEIIWEKSSKFYNQ